MYTYLVIPNNSKFFLFHKFDAYIHSNNFLNSLIIDNISLNILHNQKKDENENDKVNSDFKIKSLKISFSQKIPDKYLLTEKFIFSFLCEE